MIEYLDSAVAHTPHQQLFFKTSLPPIFKGSNVLSRDNPLQHGGFFYTRAEQTLDYVDFIQFNID